MLHNDAERYSNLYFGYISMHPGASVSDFEPAFVAADETVNSTKAESCDFRYSAEILGFENITTVQPQYMVLLFLRGGGFMKLKRLSGLSEHAVV